MVAAAFCVWLQGRGEVDLARPARRLCCYEPQMRYGALIMAGSKTGPTWLLFTSANAKERARFPDFEDPLYQMIVNAEQRQAPFHGADKNGKSAAQLCHTTPRESRCDKITYLIQHHPRLRT